MGFTAENVARQYGVSREDPDAFALRSHQRAAAAQEAGKFVDETVPLDVTVKTGSGSEAKRPALSFAKDEGVRRKDTSVEALGKAQAGLSCQRDHHRRQ